LIDLSSLRRGETFAEERRRYLRVPVALSIRFRGVENFSEFIQANLKDLSPRGLFIRSMQVKPVGSEVLIQIADGNGGFHTIKGVVRCVIEPGESQVNLEPGMGIEFISVDLVLENLIQTVISNHRVEAIG